VTIKEILQKYSADAVRIFVLNSHYRSPLTYSEETLEAAEGGVERLLRVVSRDDPASGKREALDAEPYRKQFIEAMDDDFNTPRALAALFDLGRAINQAADSGVSFRDARDMIIKLAHDILGLKLEESESLREPDPETQQRVSQLIEERAMLRKEKQWQQADKIRAELAEMGITLEDTPKGTVWKRKR
jgi:cysteinyl-tRNA synthetase